MIEIKITLNRFAQLGSQKKITQKRSLEDFSFFFIYKQYVTFQKYKKLLGIVSIVAWEIIQIKTTNYRKYIFRFDLNLFIHFVFLPSLHVCTLVNISVKKLRTRICEDDKVLANHFPTIFLLLYANLLKLIYLFY